MLARRLPTILVALVVSALVLAALSAGAVVGVTLDILAWAVSDDLNPPASADIESPLRLTTAAVWLVAATLWAIWFWLALRVVEPTGRLRAEPALTLALLFVPVVTWVTTRRALGDLWRAARPDPSPPAATDVALRMWWPIVILFSIAAAVAVALGLAAAEAVYIEDQVTSYRADAMAYGLGVPASLLGALVTWRVSRRVQSIAPVDLIPVSAAAARDPADDAAGRAPLAVRAMGWLAWGAAGLAGLYAVLTLWVLLGAPSRDALAVVEVGVAAPLALALLVPAALWLWWFFAAVAAYRVRSGGVSPAWATSAWLIPPFCFVVPWRALARLLRTAGHRDRQLVVAWVTWSAAFVVIVAPTVSAVSETPDPETWRWYGPASLSAYLLSALSAAALRRVTRVIAAAPSSTAGG